MIAVWLVGWNKEKRKKSPHPSDVCVMNVPTQAQVGRIF